MRIAIWQTFSLAGDKAANLARLDGTLRAAAAAGADLLLTPECWLTGYNHPELIRSGAEPAEGESAGAIAALARTHQIAIAYGYAERGVDAEIYNAAQIIGADGAILGHYRKTHLWGAMEHSLYKPGDRLAAPIEFRGRRLGLLICYDVEFPETVRSLAAAGAELILVPTAVNQGGTLVPRYLVPARAIESLVHIAYANHAGREGDLLYCGASCLCGPLGKIAAAGSGETLLIADLDGDAVKLAEQQVPYWRDRRPALYRLPDET